LGVHLALTLISCSIFYLEAPVTIKTYTQLWNRVAFSTLQFRTYLHLFQLLKSPLLALNLISIVI
ncbi:hypothetical protein HETIRDRAFT_305489, partial [Heterobasidion irregulare TC 32-1]